MSQTNSTASPPPCFLLSLCFLLLCVCVLRCFLVFLFRCLSFGRVAFSFVAADPPTPPTDDRHKAKQSKAAHTYTYTHAAHGQYGNRITPAAHCGTLFLSSSHPLLPFCLVSPGEWLDFSLMVLSPSSSVPPTAHAAAAASTSPPHRPTPRKQPFWLGGVASMGAACCSHPLDLLKVRLQCTQAPATPCGSGHNTEDTIETRNKTKNNYKLHTHTQL